MMNRFVHEVAIYTNGKCYGLISSNLETCTPADNRSISLEYADNDVAVFVGVRNLQDLVPFRIRELENKPCETHCNVYFVSSGKVVMKRFYKEVTEKTEKGLHVLSFHNQTGFINWKGEESGEMTTYVPIIDRGYGNENVPKGLLKQISVLTNSKGYDYKKMNEIFDKIYNGKNLCDADPVLHDIIKQCTDKYLRRHYDYRKSFTSYENVFFKLLERRCDDLPF